MRLKSIKLAGFKSFVDPTPVDFPSQLCAVVGPNGCGKSNIIDAVRWVMGESSAKNLRGESMTDVIFNGSTHRKPVGQCTIELIFDNSDGRVTGEFAQYNEISIKRRVTRDGKSDYFLNGTKCRRRDITDIFLGTGLGARSYSIIEQGMISQLIEAKPDELRVYLEEAAGISKYKERRKETERRMSHTQENLERLNDLRDELERQLNHLHQQAQVAEKYTQLKEQERLVRAQLHALKWRTINQALTQQGQAVHAEQLKLEQENTQLTSLEAQIEHIRLEHSELSDQFNLVQGEFYELSSDISRQEQMITHTEERSGQLKKDIEQAEQDCQNSQTTLDRDEGTLLTLSQTLDDKTPELEQAAEQAEQLEFSLEQAENDIYEWQQEFEQFNHEVAQTKQQAQVEQARVQQFDEQIKQLNIRQHRLNEELAILEKDIQQDDTDELNALVEEQNHICEQQEQALIQTIQSIEQQTEKNRSIGQKLNEFKEQLQTAKGRCASLEALQQAALNDGNETRSQWLIEHELNTKPCLADIISTDSQYQPLVEWVLKEDFTSLCTDSLDQHEHVLTQENTPSLCLIEPSDTIDLDVTKNIPLTPLLEYVEPKTITQGLLSGVFVGDNINQALKIRKKLAPHQSIVTLDRYWVGVNFLRTFSNDDQNLGVLARKEELIQLRETIEHCQLESDILEQAADEGKTTLQKLELERSDYQHRFNVANRQLAQHQAKASSALSKYEQLTIRIKNIEKELLEITEQTDIEQERMSDSRSILQQALETMAEQMTEKEQQGSKKQILFDQRDQIRNNYQSIKARYHELQLEQRSVSAQHDAINQSKGRLIEQLTEFTKRLDYLNQQLAKNQEPIDDLRTALAEKLDRRLDIEHALTKARSGVSDIEIQLRQAEQSRILLLQQIETTRVRLEQLRIDNQTQTVQRSTLEDQLIEQNYQLEAVLETLPDDANEPEWQEQLAKVGQKIQRLGPINLAAVDEYKTQSERKQYLDTQHQDLEDALETLAEAIRKIDRETRTRFKETFDKVNQGIQELFPKMFGGGHAYLELVGEDLLDTGITIMARPPGKKNSTIHLLSGGEKALTAIALVFSIFRLNPAPFCMLDEVDAPLDDANVGRLCNLVQDMSEKVQFIYITHNKVSMEMASQLMGVTMQEPGVSRLVSVDVEEAVALAGA